MIGNYGGVVVYADDAGGGVACCGEGGDGSWGERLCGCERYARGAKRSNIFERLHLERRSEMKLEFCINNEKQIKRIKR